MAQSSLNGEACVAQALECLGEAGLDPARKDYWIAEAIQWLQHSTEAWSQQSKHSRADASPGRAEIAHA